MEKTVSQNAIVLRVVSYLCFSRFLWTLTLKESIYIGKKISMGFFQATKYLVILGRRGKKKQNRKEKKEKRICVHIYDRRKPIINKRNDIITRK
jgi:hypothetical protein